MICVGIDVAKDKHDCFILSSEGEVLADVFAIPNSMEGFQFLLEKIHNCISPQDSIKVGLEATGHYSYSLLEFLLDSGLPTYVLNPLHTSLYRKSLSLRKTKTDKVDARTIAAMLLPDLGLKPYTDTACHNEELKSLTRYRFDKVRERAKLKQSVSRLVCILFPELEKLVSTLHMNSVYALLKEFPGAKQIAQANLTRLKSLLFGSSKGHYKRDMAVTIRDAARASVGSVMSAKSLELRHTIRLIRELDAEIADIEVSVQSILEELHSPITTIPGIGTRMGAMILTEVGDFSRFVLLTRFWLTPVCLPPPTSPDNSTTAMLTWKNEVPDTCALPFITPPSTSAFGTPPLLHPLPRHEQRTSTTMWPYPMPPRNWYGSSMQWRSPGLLTSLWLLYNSFHHLLSWCPHGRLLPCAVLHRLVVLPPPFQGLT